VSRIKRIVGEIANHLEPVRKWLDGEDARDPATKIREASREASQAESFMLSVAREIDRVLREEFVANRIKGTAYVPARFAVFLSSVADRAWTGQKRVFLQETLADIIFQEARKLCGAKLKLTLTAISVELRIDGTLGDEELYVRPVSDDGSDVTVYSSGSNKVPSPEGAGSAGDTIYDPARGRRGAKPLYFLELFENATRQQRIPVYNSEVTIGRGGAGSPVDIPLTGEPRISRVHVSLRFDEKNQLWVTAQGTNPTLISGRLLARGESTKLKPNEGIQIYDFTLHYKARPRRRKRNAKQT